VVNPLLLGLPVVGSGGGGEDAADGLEEVVEGERLGEELDIGSGMDAGFESGGGIAGDEDHLHQRMSVAEFLGDFQSVGVIFEHPIDHEDIGGKLPSDIEGFLAGGGGFHLIAFIRNEQAKGVTVGRLIVDDQDSWFFHDETLAKIDGVAGRKDERSERGRGTRGIQIA
jgi:hypothetical protein